jgi:PPOX class probable F420-dependent enzyme
MSSLPPELRDLIESGPMAHLSTINADGSPQVSVIWVGLDGDDLVSGHMSRYAKLRNIERDPRVVLSFDAPRAPGVFMNPYAVLRAGPPSSPATTRGTCSTA